MFLFRCEGGSIVDLEKVLYFKKHRNAQGWHVLAVFSLASGDFVADEHSKTLAHFQTEQEAQRFIDALARLMIENSRRLLTVDDVKRAMNEQK